MDSSTTDRVSEKAMESSNGVVLSNECEWWSAICPQEIVSTEFDELSARECPTEFGVVEYYRLVFVRHSGLEGGNHDGVNNTAEYVAEQQDGERGTDILFVRLVLNTMIVLFAIC